MRPKLVAFAVITAFFTAFGSVLIHNSVMGDARHEEMKEACCLGDTMTIKTLLRRGEDVNAPVWEDWTALMYAADNTRPDAVRVLIGAGADVNAVTGKGLTALSLAHGHRSDEARQVTSILIAAGAK